MAPLPTPDQDPTPAQAALRQLADSANMLVWMTDANDIYTYLNGSASLQFTTGERIPVSAWFQFIHPDDLPRVAAELTTLKGLRREYQLEYRIVKSDGSIRWVIGCGAPRHSDDGDFLGYIGTLIDVTDHHSALSRLMKSEAEHRLLTENSSDVISRHAADGTVVYVSPSVKHVFGFEASELVGTNIFDHVHPDDVPLIRDEVRKQVETRAESSVIEFRKLHKNGNYVWIATKARVLADPLENEKIGTVSVSRDITLERQAREELRRREEQFRRLTALSSDWYWETDERGRFVALSDNGEMLSRLAPQHVIGKTRSDIAADPDHPGLRAYTGKIALREPFKNIRYPAVGRDAGTTRLVSVSGEPVFREGIFKGYQGVARDVTEEVEVAERLARLAAENKALVENSLDIMAIFDPEGRFVRVNGAATELLGYQPADLLGRHFFDFVVPEEREATKAKGMDLRRRGNTIQDFEERWIRKDGIIVHLSWSLRLADDGRLIYATARDVTERHQTRAALQHSKDRLNTILESIGDAFYTLDRDWRITYANRKATAFVNTSLEAALGKVIWEVVPAIPDSSVFPYLQSAMETGANTFFETYYEPARAWVEVRAYPNEDGLAVFFHDVTARRETEVAIRNSEQRLREIIQLTPAGYILADANAGILDVNPALCRLAGYARHELVGKNLAMLFASCPWHGALAIQGGPVSAQALEAAVKHRDGHEVPVLFSGRINRDADGHAQCFTAFLTDITGRKQAESRMEHLATHDVLTGLPNRAFLNARVQQMLEDAPRTHDLAVMFIDLDRFKEVNDSFGHNSGDALLCEIAQRLRSNLRPEDVIVRLGGDEFVVVAWCPAGRKSASVIAAKLLSVLTDPVMVADQEVYVSASIGISMLAEGASTKELLFQNADTAMYRAKEAGRNGYRFFEPGMSNAVKTRMTLAGALRHALGRGEFELHYQPRVDLKSMTVIGMEALLRWNHPQFGQVPPMEFIPIAEETGLIGRIGAWVLEEACAHTMDLMQKLGRPLRISVNLSAKQLQSKAIVEELASVLRRTGIPPDLLELELTESALIEDIKYSTAVLKELKTLGIQLAVDDFGTGYSGFAYFRRFPLDVLKLDRSFVMQQDDGVSNAEFIKAFVDMAHALKLSVVGEGIENPEIMKLLIDAGCDEGQGFLFAKPMPRSELEAFLAGSGTQRPLGAGREAAA